MKRIEELGISSWPWHTFDDNWIESADGSPAMSNSAYACNQNDSRLIAASPELYDALRSAVIEMCHDCPLCDYADGEYRCNEDADKCFVNKWREVLAKASGEEAK